MSSTLLDAGMLGTQVLTITGDANEAAIAAAYGGWLASIIGSVPEAHNVARPSGRDMAKIILTEDQVFKLREWLDSQLGNMMNPSGEPEVVDYGLGPVLGPWALQRTIPIILGAVVAGWVAHWLLSK